MVPIPINKIGLHAKKEYQILSNYKLLQMGFNKVGISREVPVDKLMKFKLQDNLEFLQWFCRLASNAERDGPVTKASEVSQDIPRSRISSSSRASTGTISLRTNRNAVNSSMTPSQQHKAGLRRAFTSHDVSQNGSIRLKDEIRDLQARLDESLQTQESLETERNFYFNKLREIEIICQNLNDKIEANENDNPQDVTVADLVNHIQEIMYSTAEGFQVPQETIQSTLTSPQLTPGSSNNKENNLTILDEETF
ncbi:hypothetical protein FOA43_002593 [Brettanomyces nanus]|uniref:EB1 C-terminal domain-containing protein n=1 Tax=Eeniella nana TaxID=13502 RepID=A0A875S2V3_EENNA|nr:uncharacterized protein FOA43_002593 [Brettanomyces nanus]QPG75243.1 hypothetical protein FOA43_002593 [Brettanomyces nanus]